MARKLTSSYVLTLKLDINTRDESILNKRLEICRKLYNSILGLGLKRFKALTELKDYRKLRKDLADLNKSYHTADNVINLNLIKKLRNEKYKELVYLLGTYRITEYSLINEMTSMYKPFKKNIDNKTAQALASRAWKALEKLIFSTAEHVNFIRFNELYSIEGKWNKSGIRYDINFNVIKWNKLILPVVIKNTDLYAQKAIQDKIKYCRLVRKFIRGIYKYYVQLILEGIPPMKYSSEMGEVKNNVGTGNVGIAIGTRTLALSSKYAVKLLELCPEVEIIEHEKRKLLRKLDRQRRSINPINYTEAGILKRGIKLNWVNSNKYIKTQNKLRETQRKYVVLRKQSHEKLANYIISLGDTIFVEHLHFQGLPKRSKKNLTIKNSNSIFIKKKCSGKRLSNKAPSMLLEIINRKLNYAGIELLKIKTKKFKASHYNHFTQEYDTDELKFRWNKDINLQQDMYSAFLIMNANNDLETVNQDKCNVTYANFKVLHDKEVTKLKDLKNKGKGYKSLFYIDL